MEEGENTEDKDKIKIVSLNVPQTENQRMQYTCSITFSSDAAHSQMQPESGVEELENFVVQPAHVRQWPDFVRLPTENFSKSLLEDLHKEIKLSWD